MPPQGWGGGSIPRTASASVLPPSRKGTGLPAEGLHRAAPALVAWRARRGVALDITALPGTALLSAKVSHPCYHLGMMLMPHVAL